MVKCNIDYSCGHAQNVTLIHKHSNTMKNSHCETTNMYIICAVWHIVSMTAHNKERTIQPKC